MLKISYSQVKFITILHSKVFLGKFGHKSWSSPNWLKFGAGFHCYIVISNLMFVFPKFLLFTFYWASLVLKPEVLQINRYLVQGYIAICLLRFWCLFFQNLCHSCFFLIKFGPIIWISSNWSKFCRGLHFYMLNAVLMFISSRFFSFMFFGQIWSQNQKFFKLTKIWYRGRSLYAYFDFNVYFFKIFVIHIFWANLVPKSEVLQIN